MKKHIISMMVMGVMISPFPASAKGLNDPGVAWGRDKHKEELLAKLKVMRRQHHYLIQYRNDDPSDGIVHIKLIRTNDDKVRFNSFPYGMTNVDGHKPYRRYSLDDFEKILKSRVAKRNKLKPVLAPIKPKQSGMAMTADANPLAYNTGLGLGYNPSTGYLGSGNECFNYTTALSGGIINDSFSSQNTSSSMSGQLNVSASISASYGLFKASDTFTYGNNYNTSANSGQTYFNAYAVYNTTNTFYGLSTYGSQSTAFSANCGSEFLSSVPAGVLITGQFQWSTSSSSNSTTISNDMKASYGLDSINAAVSDSTSSANTSNSFDFVYNLNGGGEAAANTMGTAYTNNLSTMDSCFSGTTTDCTTFTLALSGAATTSIDTFAATYDNPPGGLPSNLSDMTVFAQGIAGVQLQQNSTSTINGLLNTTGYNDNFTPDLTSAVQNYETIINQISTLNNRANYLITALGGTKTSNGFDPLPNMSLRGGYLAPLQAVYQGDVNAMNVNLTNCMSAPSSTQTTECQPIVDVYNDKITDAFEWYSNGSGNPNNFAAQNAIALQYVGLASYYGEMTQQFPLDVMWIAATPPFWVQPPPSVTPPVPSINNQSAVVALADAPFPYGSSLTIETNAWAQLFTAANSNFNGVISFANPYQTVLANGDTAYTGWRQWGNAQQTVFLNACAGSTFIVLCGIESYSAYYNTDGSYAYSEVTTLSGIPQFFGP